MTQPRTPEQIALTMQRYYERAYNEILGLLTNARQRDNYWTIAKQAHILKQIAKILDRFHRVGGGHFESAMKKISEYQTRLAIADLKKFKQDLSYTTKWHLEYNEKQVAQACADTFDHIAGQTDKMKRDIKQQLRSESAEIFRMAAVKGTSRKKAFRELRDKILTKNPNFQFTDKAGKKWDAKTYLNMLTHTVASKAQRDLYANTLANEGHDLVRIPPNGAVDACKNWEGKILSLTGATPGYSTLAGATATNEIFHPRCRHRFVVYDLDIEETFKEKAA